MHSTCVFFENIHKERAFKLHGNIALGYMETQDSLNMQIKMHSHI